MKELDHKWMSISVIFITNAEGVLGKKKVPSVDRDGIEPSTSSLSVKRSTGELPIPKS